MVDQPNLEQAAVADETAQSPAQDATEPQQKEAAPPPKEEPAEPPPWLNAPLDAGPAQSPYVPHYGGQNYQPQYQIPPPQFGPPARQQFQPGRKLTLQELAADPDAAINSKIEERAFQMVLPVLEEVRAQRSRLAELDQFGQRQHEAHVAQEFDRSRSAIRDSYGAVFGRDPAFRNRAVQERVDTAVRGYLIRAVQEAAATGNTSGLENIRSPKILKTILTWAKEDAGWNDQAQRIDIQGSQLESSRSAPSGGYSLSDDEREAARYLNISEEAYAKEKAEANKRRGGWL